MKHKEKDKHIQRERQKMKHKDKDKHIQRKTKNDT